jgi:hypothetical protein
MNIRFNCCTNIKSRSIKSALAIIAASTAIAICSPPPVAAETPSCGKEACSADGSSRAQLAPAETPTESSARKPDGSAPVLGSETPPAPPPSNAITAPANKSTASKSPVLSAPGSSESKTASGVITAPSSDKPASATTPGKSSAVLTAPSGSTPSGAAPVLSAPTAVDSEGPADPGLSVKQSLFHDLNMKSIRAKKEYSIKIDITTAEDVCLKQPSSVAECRKAVDEIGDKIDSKVNEAVTIRNQQQSLRIEEERNNLLAEQNRIQAEKPDVVVIDRAHHLHHGDIIDQRAVVESSGFGVSGSLSGPNGSISVHGGSSTVVETGTAPIIDHGTTRPPTISAPGPFTKPYKPSALPTPKR